MKRFTSEIIIKLHKLLPELSGNQIKFVLDIIGVLSEPYEYKEIGNEWIFNEDFINIFSDYVRMHHALSDEPFTKDKFEFALDRTCNVIGLSSILPGRTNPGHDIEIDGKKISLKTQANASIKEKYLHISKFMELGKGKWENIDDLHTFRDQFIKHMDDYEMIISLRCLSSLEERKLGLWKYEMIEIPKELLLKAKTGVFEMKNESK